MKIAAISFLVTVAVALGGVHAQAQGAVPDATPSAAGAVTGVIVIFSPSFGAVPTMLPLPGPLSPTIPGPVLPGILLTAPTSVGSLVVPVQLPSISGSPAFTQLQLVLPGPNPFQNTPIALAQLLNVVQRPVQPLGPAGAAAPGLPVSVLATPSR